MKTKQKYNGADNREMKKFLIGVVSGREFTQEEKRLFKAFKFTEEGFRAEAKNQLAEHFKIGGESTKKQSPEAVL